MRFNGVAAKHKFECRVPVSGSSFQKCLIDIMSASHPIHFSTFSLSAFVTHPTVTVVLTRKVATANDATLSIAIAAGLGVTAVVSSVNTTAGVGLAANEFKIGADASAIFQ